VPTSYQLGGVTKEGDHPQSISKRAELWKGRHDGEVVALKVLDHTRRDTKQVSISCDPRSGELLVVVLTGEMAALRESSIEKTA